MCCSQDEKPFACKATFGGTTPKPTPPPTGFCPEGFSQFQTQCYKLVPQAANWTVARESCNKFGYGYDLVSVHSMKENAFVVSMLYEDSNGKSDEVWIGGICEDYLKHMHQYHWSDESPFNIDNWAENEPNSVSISDELLMRFNVKSSNVPIYPPSTLRAWLSNHFSFLSLTV